MKRNMKKPLVFIMALMMMIFTREQISKDLQLLRVYSVQMMEHFMLLMAEKKLFSNLIQITIT